MKSTRQKALLLACATKNKKALDPAVLDVRGLSPMVDYFVIASGNTDVQVHAISMEVERVCRENGLTVLHQEGRQGSCWVLLDLGDILVHIFRQPERQYYQLESLFPKAKRVGLPKY